jgi:hypothetical protein
MRFDAVVLHTTTLCMRWNVWFDQWRRRLDWLADLDALKIALPQDEYDHAHTLDDWLSDLGVSVVGTVLDDRHRAELYPRLEGSAAFYDVLTGYIDEPTALRIASTLTPLAARPNDVVYRARKLPYWFGSQGQQKHEIGDAVLERGVAQGLVCDVSTRAQEVFLGDSWLQFLASGRTTIGTESGSSVLDRRGETRARISELLHDEPGLSFAEVDARMPAGWDDYRFLAVSPRHLEAVVTRTAQILVEGRYSGVLEPGRHYIPVKPDFSDLDEALEQARDPELLERLVDHAYQDVYRSGRYSSRALTDTLARMLAEHARAAGASPGAAWRAASRLAGLEGELERVAVAPAWNVVRVGRAGARELAAGLRLLSRDRPLRRLLVRYLRSAEAREHVSPRQALADLLCLGTLRRARAGRFDGHLPYSVTASIDPERKRLLLRSAPPGGCNGSVSRHEVERLLRTSAVDVSWDHSAVGRSVEFRVPGASPWRLELPAGPHGLPVLNWLARSHPADVTAALAPLLDP